MQLAEFDYALPEEAIAQHPVEPRDAARLLVDGGPGAAPSHLTVADLPELVRPGDVIVVNTTRVLPARLHLRKATGGAAEVALPERAGGGRWSATTVAGWSTCTWAGPRTSWPSWSGTAPCRCRPTSRPRWPTPSATRPSTPTGRGRWRRRRPAST